MYLLDSSAWLIHLFNEVGVEQVNQLFDDEASAITISTLSLVEVYARLRAMNRENRWEEVWEQYSYLFTTVLPATREVAEQAILMRSKSPSRIPTIDAMIAATAAVNRGTLVHRDPRLAAIPAELVSQIQLIAA